MFLHCSFFLWSISHPGKTGIPGFDLTADEQSLVIDSKHFTPLQLRYERVIVKTFTHYCIPWTITDTIRQIFRSKLRRMGMQLARCGSKSRLLTLDKWKNGTQCIWYFTLDACKVNQQLLKEKSEMEAKLKREVDERKKCEEDILKLKKQQLGGKSYERKPLADVSRQQQYNRKMEMVSTVQSSLTSCKLKDFEPCLLEMKEKNSGERMIIDVRKGTFTPKLEHSKPCNAHSSLYVKDKYAVSNEAYHHLSMLSNLPSSHVVKKLSTSLNLEFSIQRCPNGVTGVQQSIKMRLLQRLTKFVCNAKQEGMCVPTTLKIKLTGDGTRIARGYNIVNVAFTILNEGKKAYSVLGNYTIAILKTSEHYEELRLGLADICAEAKDIEVLAIDGNVYNILFFLGGDMKFLATVCGIEQANAKYSCIWCKCPTERRSDITLEWSVTDTAKGARTIEEIEESSKLGKRNKNRFSCCQKPIFPFIPIERIVIDSLHLFLRIADVLINLLIRDLVIKDGINKVTEIPINSYTKSYETILNETCKIRFQWNVDKVSKEIKYRDLTGPEKVRLFTHMDIAEKFPALSKAKELGKLWKDFLSLVQDINKETCDADDLRRKIKLWVTLYLSVYQTKDVTPYIHSFLNHVPEFIRLHGNLISFTQQGLEKLNDVSTKEFQRASNHRDIEALQQMLEKRNRLEHLEDNDHAPVKSTQKCSRCKESGHNKRSCKENMTS